VADQPKVHPHIPSPETLLPLPEAALRLVQLVRDWLPYEPATGPAVFDARMGLLSAVEAAHRATSLVGQARVELASSGPFVCRGSGWQNAQLVLAWLNRLAEALRGLLTHLGWAGLWGADRLVIASEETKVDGKPIKEAEPAPGVALIVEPKSPHHVPSALLEAVQSAAERLRQELEPTAVVLAAGSALAPERSVPAPTQLNPFLARLAELAPRFEAGREAHPNVWMLVAAGDGESCPPPITLYMRAQCTVWRRWSSRPKLAPSNPEHDPLEPILLRRREGLAPPGPPLRPPSCDECAHLFGSAADLVAFIAAAESAGGLLDSTSSCPPVSELLAGTHLHSAPLPRWIGWVHATLKQHRPSLILRPPPTPDGIELYILDMDPWEASLLTIRLLLAQAVLQHGPSSSPPQRQDQQTAATITQARKMGNNRLDAAFRPILEAESTPSYEAVVALGHALAEARLYEFIGNCDNPGRGVLTAATRLHLPLTPEDQARVNDEAFIRGQLAQLDAGEAWLYARDNLRKFKKRVDQELADREWPVQNQTAHRDESHWKNRIAALRDGAAKAYAESKGQFWLAAVPADLQLGRCDQHDPACGTVTDGRVLLPWRSIKDLGSTDLGSNGAFNLLAFTVSPQAHEEFQRFLSFAAEAGAALIAHPPAWAHSVRRPGSPDETWVAALMFICPTTAAGVVENPGGCRLMTQPWAAAIKALRDWHTVPASQAKQGGEAAAMSSPAPTAEAKPPATSLATPPSTSDESAPEIDQEAQALALLFQHPDWSIQQIAEHLKVDRRTPYRWEKFRKAAEAAGRMKPRGRKDRRPHRGHKTSDGQIEAYSEDDEDE
jgi:hypothetical protein